MFFGNSVAKTNVSIGSPLQAVSQHFEVLLGPFPDEQVLSRISHFGREVDVDPSPLKLFFFLSVEVLADID